MACMRVGVGGLSSTGLGFYRGVVGESADYWTSGVPVIDVHPLKANRAANTMDDSFSCVFISALLLAALIVNEPFETPAS